jgi:hypothetical protein
MADLTRCTCGGENSDGRGDVLECVVHGIGAPAFSHRPETVNDMVESEARHDWLDERDGLERGDDGP